MILYFVSHNEHKIKEIQHPVPSSIQLLGLNDLGWTEEIEETGDSLEENALIKARAVFAKFHINCFAEDTGLEVAFLNGKPGVHTARYAAPRASATENINLLLKEMKNAEQRQARFRTVIALILSGEEYLFEGIINGNISKQSLGKNGFGYDPVFIPENYTMSFAELGEDIKNNISHRALAMEKLISFLKLRNKING